MSKILRKDEIDSAKIIEISKALKNGKLIIFPTDTVYGIGTNAYSEDACNKIYKIKRRDKNKPLIVLISDMNMLKELVGDISPLEKKLINTFWPGDLTIKFEKKKNVLPNIVSAGDKYVRLRLLNEGITYRLIQTSGVPLVAPSANLSGSATGTKIKNIINELGGGSGLYPGLWRYKK